MVDRAEHCFLFDPHYALAKSHWQQVVTEGHSKLVVMEALRCPLPNVNNGEDNALFKSLIGTLLKCPGPGHCADPLICKAGFFQVTVAESSKQTDASELPDWIDHHRFTPRNHCVFQEKRMPTTWPQIAAVDSNGRLGVLKFKFWLRRQLTFQMKPKELQCSQTRLY